MKRSNPADKLAKKKQAWISRTSLVLGVSEEESARLLATPRQQSIRLNTLKLPEGFEPLSPENGLDFIGDQFDWMPDGFTLTLPVADIRDQETVTSGKVYIQNAASWLPVLALDPQPSESILDVCAAPGGKTSHIAAITGNQARITANDNSRPRLAKLRSNLERLGVTAEYTLYDATMIARKLDGQQFDRILIDAPCSGEGLMDINRDKDFTTWSVAHIKRLQQLQKRILIQAWQLLRPGGILVYSTCTMAPEEDEAVVDYLLRNQNDVRIIPFDIDLPNRVPAVTTWNGKQFSPAVKGCMRLQPSEQIEAFFVCKIAKDI